MFRRIAAPAFPIAIGISGPVTGQDGAGRASPPTLKQKPATQMTVRPRMFKVIEAEGRTLFEIRDGRFGGEMFW